MIYTHLLKFLDEYDIREVLNCRKWPQKLVLDYHDFPLVTRFKPRAWHPNNFLVPSTSPVQMRKKCKGH